MTNTFSISCTDPQLLWDQVTLNIPSTWEWGTHKTIAVSPNQSQCGEWLKTSEIQGMICLLLDILPLEPNFKLDNHVRFLTGVLVSLFTAWIWGLHLELFGELQWQWCSVSLQNTIKSWDGSQEPWQAKARQTWTQSGDYIGAILVPSNCYFSFLFSVILGVLAETQCFRKKSRRQVNLSSVWICLFLS